MLTRETVERQIREMWAELSNLPHDDPDTVQALQDGHEIEAKVRAKLARQERMHTHAYEMFEALKNMLRSCVGNYEQGSPAALAQKEASAVIAKIEGQA